MQRDVVDRVDAAIRENHDRSIEELKAFCAQPSISARMEGIRETADMLKEMLERRGFQVQIMDTGGAPVVYAEGGEGDRTLLMYNHYDVQPPEPLELWDTPAFEPAIRDGKLYARGVADDKGQIECRLAAIDAILSTHGSLPCRIKFVVEGEEEIGSVNLAPFIERHADLLSADACLWEGGGMDFDGRPNIALGYRGMLYIELRTRTLGHDQHSGGAGLMPSAAWTLVRALSSLKDAKDHILISGFYDDVREPSDLDLQFLRENVDPKQEAQTKQLAGISEYVRGLTGFDALREVFNPTCNIAGIVSGHTGSGPKTIVPAEAMAKIDFRLVPDQDPDDIIRKVRAHLDAHGFANVEMHVLGGEAPGKTPADDPYVQMCRATAEEVYGKPAHVIPIVGGTGPVHPFITVLGTPILTGGSGSPGSMVHAPNENMSLEAFNLGARHIARMILAMPEVAATPRT